MKRIASNITIPLTILSAFSFRRMLNDSLGRSLEISTCAFTARRSIGGRLFRGRGRCAKNVHKTHARIDEHAHKKQQRNKKKTIPDEMDQWKRGFDYYIAVAD